MITVKRLSTPDLVEEAWALLYSSYIEQLKWNFSPNNPSKLRVVTSHNKKILIDRFSEQAIWFGAFDNNALVGCIRLCGVDENDQLEIEGYASSQPVRQYLPQQKKACFEISKLATRQDYIGRGIVKRLFLALFKYCEENRYSTITCTHNNYLKALYKKIGFPVKKEHAFKYEEQDPSPVNFYFADYEKSEIHKIVKNLEHLESDLNSNATRIFKALETVEPILPTPFYWMDVNGVVLGINDLCLQAIGTTREIIGKKPYEFYKKEIADHILKHNAEVIRTGEILGQEEWIEDVTTKEKKCFSAIKAPLYDDEGKIIGIVGTSVEITAQKEAERLKLENEAHQIHLEEQKKYTEIAKQVAHDIRSPLASLLMLVKSCSELPEAERIAFREVAMTIEDIANNLLSHYRARGEDTGTEERTPILVSALLLQLLTDKKYQYKDQPIKFEHDFTQKGNFAFIKIEATALKRSVSNIMNNAVDAFEGKGGRITLKLDATNEWVKIIIQDNGKGMPPQLVNKIIKNISVTQGKKEGHGIGLTQVRETLQRNQGELSIDSVVGDGTKITLTFPRITPPSWIAETIELGKEDIVIILDDDNSIHAAWDTHFQKILQKAPGIRLEHFKESKKALEFINALAAQDKEKVFLLTDYELLKQELNGLHVVEQGKIKRSVLVTSHYTNEVVYEHAAKTGTKILPKQLASEIPIIINEIIKPRRADLIIVDDDERYVRNMIDTAFVDLTVDHYTSPEHFLTVVEQYPKDTKICLDQNFNDSRMDGLYLAEQLNKLGYTKLFLISGEEFDKRKLPKYLTVLGKSYIEKVKEH